MSIDSSGYRNVSFDVLRIISAFGVIMIHLSARGLYEYTPSVDWTVRNFYNSLFRYSVPIFVMISGALFLNTAKKIDLTKLYGKYILRIVLVFTFWSIIYVVYEGVEGRNLFDTLQEILIGPFHLWYLKMLIGLYIAVPIMRAIVLDRKIEKYFICVAIVMASLYPMCLQVMGYLNDSAKLLLSISYEGLDFHIALGYVGYFVLGHYIFTYSLRRNIVRAVYVLAALSVFTVFVLSQSASAYIGGAYTGFYEYLNLFTMFEASAIFIIINKMNFAHKYHVLLKKVSDATLGIYVVHVLVMYMIFHYIDFLSLYNIVLIPCYAVLIFILSYIIVEILIRIPIINRIVK